MKKTDKRKMEIKNIMTSKGWELDRWGHLKKTNENDRIYRIKMCARVMRLEKKIKVGFKNEWMRIISVYYSKVTDNELDKMDSIIS